MATFDWPAVGYYALAGAIGSAVGLADLIERYKDAPVRALRNLPALFYCILNAAAAVLALAFVKGFGWHLALNPTVAGTPLAQASTAGVASAALFRVSLHIRRARPEDAPVVVGPSKILDAFMRAADQGVDRSRGSDRAKDVRLIMDGVNFAEAAVALPLYCAGLMQNLSRQDQDVLGAAVHALNTTDLENDVLAQLLGLLRRDWAPTGNVCR